MNVIKVNVVSISCYEVWCAFSHASCMNALFRVHAFCVYVFCICDVIMFVCASYIFLQKWQAPSPRTTQPHAGCCWVLRLLTDSKDLVAHRLTLDVGQILMSNQRRLPARLLPTNTYIPLPTPCKGWILLLVFLACSEHYSNSIRVQVCWDAMIWVRHFNRLSSVLDNVLVIWNIVYIFWCPELKQCKEPSFCSFMARVVDFGDACTNVTEPLLWRCVSKL
jgi:hypothetical protein